MRTAGLLSSHGEEWLAQVRRERLAGERSAAERPAAGGGAVEHGGVRERKESALPSRGDEKKLSHKLDKAFACTALARRLILGLPWPGTHLLTSRSPHARSGPEARGHWRMLQEITHTPHRQPGPQQPPTLIPPAVRAARFLNPDALFVAAHAYTTRH